MSVGVSESVSSSMSMAKCKAENCYKSYRCLLIASQEPESRPWGCSKEQIGCNGRGGSGRAATVVFIGKQPPRHWCCGFVPGSRLRCQRQSGGKLGSSVTQRPTHPRTSWRVCTLPVPGLASRLVYSRLRIRYHSDGGFWHGLDGLMSCLDASTCLQDYPTAAASESSPGQVRDAGTQLRVFRKSKQHPCRGPCALGRASLRGSYLWYEYLRLAHPRSRVLSGTD